MPPPQLVSLVLLTDLHYEDLSLYGAASVSLSRMDQETCSEAVCEEEVASNIGKICNGTSQKYANEPSQLCFHFNHHLTHLTCLRSCKTVLQCKSMCVCWVSVDCEEPEVKVEQPVTEVFQDYKVEEEVNYQNAVSNVYLGFEKYGCICFT